MFCDLCQYCISYDSGNCDGLICDNELGCEFCLIFRRGYPCSSFYDIDDGALGLPSIAPNMDYQGE